MWELIYPKRCVGCGEMGAYLCAGCVNKVVVIREPICPMCGRLAMWGVTHARCRRAWGVEGLAAVFAYKGVMKRLIGKLKYKLVTDMYEVLVELMISMGDYGVLEGKSWVMVGVPLHRRRLRWRGFNQADELGRRLAKAWGWEFMEEVLIRRRYTKSQMGLVRSERLVNVVGAFGAGENIETVMGKRVLLVDDVWTTGATMRECAKVLKRKGAGEVWGVVVGR